MVVLVQYYNILGLKLKYSITITANNDIAIIANIGLEYLNGA